MSSVRRGENGTVCVLGIAGSLRTGSYNNSLLQAAIELAPEGMEISTFHGLAEIPHYNADVDAAENPEPVARLKEAIRGADGVLIVSPEYNYGIPGVLKNAIDWASGRVASSCRACRRWTRSGSVSTAAPTAAS